MYSIPEVEELRFRWYLSVLLEVLSLTGTEYMGDLFKEGGGIESWRITLGGRSGIFSVLLLLLSSSEDVLECSEESVTLVGSLVVEGILGDLGVFVL